MADTKTTTPEGQGLAIFALTDLRTGEDITLIHQFENGVVTVAQVDKKTTPSEIIIEDMCLAAGLSDTSADRIALMGDRAFELLDRIGNLSNRQISHLLDLLETEEQQNAS